MPRPGTLRVIVPTLSGFYIQESSYPLACWHSVQRKVFTMRLEFFSGCFSIARASNSSWVKYIFNDLDYWCQSCLEHIIIVTVNIVWVTIAMELYQPRFLSKLDLIDESHDSLLIIFRQIFKQLTVKISWRTVSNIALEILLFYEPWYCRTNTWKFFVSWLRTWFTLPQFLQGLKFGSECWKHLSRLIVFATRGELRSTTSESKLSP